MPQAQVVAVTVADRRLRHVNHLVRLHLVPLASPETARADGIPVTSRARTVIDLLRTERPDAAQALLDQALQQAWIDSESLLAADPRRSGRTGNRQLRVWYDRIEPGTEAGSERRLHHVLRHGGVTGWRAQLPVQLPGGAVYVDAGFPLERLALEVDGRRWHDAFSDRFESDRNRQNELVRAGWHVLRFTWRMLSDQPHDVLHRIKQQFGRPARVTVARSGTTSGDGGVPLERFHVADDPTA